MWFKAILIVILSAIAYLLFDISRSVGEMTPENQVNVAAQILGISSPIPSYTQNSSENPFQVVIDKLKSQKESR